MSFIIFVKVVCGFISLLRYMYSCMFFDSVMKKFRISNRIDVWIDGNFLICIINLIGLV